MTTREAGVGIFGKPEPLIGDFVAYPFLFGHDGPDFKIFDEFNALAQLGAGFSVVDDLSEPPAELALDSDIGVPGEFDVFSVDLVAGETYIFSAYGSGDNPIADTFLTLYDDVGGLINYDDDGGHEFYSLLTYTADYSGTHFIGVEAYPGSGLTGDYSLDFVAVPPFDVVPDTFVDAVPITIGEIAYGHIDAGPGVVYGPSFSEVDTFSFSVEAGKIYSFAVSGGADYESDWLALPDGEIDTRVAIYDSFGNLVASNDDIGFPFDINSEVSFVATEDATYYLDVYSWAPWTGGYSITSDVTDLADFDPLEAFFWDSANNVPFDETNTAYVYFGEPGELFGEPGPNFGWNEYEIGQVMLALEEYEKVLGVNYEITDTPEDATFRLMTTTSTSFGAYMYPQDPAFGTQQGIAAFNIDSGAWTFDQQQSLEQGGFSFAVILHEFGHGHGLAHPHDTGGGSEVLFGVAGSSSLGIFDLNQGVYTVMSYNDAWTTHPDGPTPFTAANIDSGWSGTLSAFDIAALQERYGVANPYAEGNDVYLLGDANDPGVYYETIWDTGGVDEIRYEGARDAWIDLTAATIDYSPTGGGVVSFVDDVFGGYTIANGVVIENATGGEGWDVLIGNEVANELTGNGGEDIFYGREGDDLIDGGADYDYAIYDGALSDYDVRFRADGAILIEDMEWGNGNEGLDTLLGVEGYDFADDFYEMDGAQTVNVSDWYNPAWGGGYNATIELHLTDALIEGTSVSEWTLDVDLGGGGWFGGGWVNGYGAGVSFDAGTGTFSTVGQGYTLDLEATDTITFTVNVMGTGFDAEDVSFAFADLDPVAAIPSSGDPLGLALNASNLNDWGSGAVQNVSISNTTSNSVDFWGVLLDLDAGELDNLDFQSVWNANWADDGEDVYFYGKSYNQEIGAFGSADFGFNVDVLDDSGAPFTAGDYEITAPDELVLANFGLDPSMFDFG